MAFIKRNICPICGSKNYIKIFERDYFEKDIIKFIKKHFSKSFPLKILKDEKYIINECLNCSGLFQENILNDKYTKNLYESYIIEEESFRKKKDFSTQNFQTYLNELKSIEKIIKKKPSHTRILEVGAGWGYWSSLAKSCNFEVEAIDLSKTRVNFMKKNGLNSSTSLKKKYSKKFDVIYSDQTLEHVKSPFDYIKIFSKLLAKNGVIILKIPSGYSTKKKLNNNYKFSDDELVPLEHINIFNLKCFKYISKKNGFKIFFPLPVNFFLSISYFKELLVNVINYISNKKVILKKL